MTAEEFSNEFDILINSYNSPEPIIGQGPIDCNEYEKSAFLTKAQEELLISIYNGKNPFGESFENTEEARRSLSSLIKTFVTTDQVTGQTGLSTYSRFFSLPADLWYITYEAVTLNDTQLGNYNNTEVVVTPVTQDAYYRTYKSPFRGTNKRRALRLDIGGSIVEIISKYNISRYLIRYLSKPSPIITSNLTDNLSIDGISIKTECKLNPVMHRTILERAVKMALLSRVQSTGK